MDFRKWSWCAALLPMLAAGVAHAVDVPSYARCVQPDGVDNDLTNDGKAWGTGRAWKTLEFALQYQVENPGAGITEIWLVKGSGGFKYKQESGYPSRSWNITVGVTIRGGFNGETDADLRPTDSLSVLSGEIGGSDNTYHLFVIDLADAD